MSVNNVVLHCTVLTALSMYAVRLLVLCASVGNPADSRFEVTYRSRPFPSSDTARKVSFRLN